MRQLCSLTKEEVELIENYRKNKINFNELSDKYSDLLEQLDDVIHKINDIISDNEVLEDSFYYCYDKDLFQNLLAALDEE